MDQDCPEALEAAVEQTENHLESGDIEKAVRLAEYLCDGSYINFRDPDSLAKAQRSFLPRTRVQCEQTVRIYRASIEGDVGVV